MARYLFFSAGIICACLLTGCGGGSSSDSGDGLGALLLLQTLQSSSDEEVPPGPASSTITAITLSGNNGETSTVTVNGITDQDSSPNTWRVRIVMGQNGTPLDPGVDGSDTALFRYRATDQASNQAAIDVKATIVQGWVTSR